MFDWLKRILGLPRHKEPTKPSLPSLVKPAPPPALVPQERKRKYRKIIIVGVDFGTSSTKVILGDVSTGKHHLLDSVTATVGYPSFVLPSIIRISNGLAFFGPRAERPREQSIVFRSFKVCLACEIGIASCRKCDHRLQNKENGQFAVAAGEHHFVISAHELCTWYLAYIFNIARREAEQRWGKSFGLGYIFNVGAPIDQHNLEEGEEAFNKAAFWAEKMSAFVEDGTPVDGLLKAYKDISSTYPTVSGPENRRTFIQPETAAGLMPFVMSPSSPPGLYGIVDVGAGTTDVSFFRLADVVKEESRVMAFYDAGTAVVGADDIDRSLAACVLSRLKESPGSTQPLTDKLITACRRAKERIGSQQSVRIRMGETEVMISKKDVDEIAAPTIKAMVSHYIETNRRAYQKEKKLARWRSYTLFLLGGGARLSVVNEALRLTRPSEYNLHIPCQRMTAPREFEAPTDAKANFDLLAVAYGLSYPPLDFPRIFEPSEVEALQIVLPVHKKLSHEELYEER